MKYPDKQKVDVYKRQAIANGSMGRRNCSEAISCPAGIKGSGSVVVTTKSTKYLSLIHIYEGCRHGSIRSYRNGHFHTVTGCSTPCLFQTERTTYRCTFPCLLYTSYLPVPVDAHQPPVYTNPDSNKYYHYVLKVQEPSFHSRPSTNHLYPLRSMQKTCLLYTSNFVCHTSGWRDHWLCCRHLLFGCKR